MQKYAFIVYDIKPAENGKWIRLRTNGKVTTLTYKDIVSNTLDGTKEVEFEVEDFDKANEFLEKIGFINRSYQENERIQLLLLLLKLTKKVSKFTRILRF